MKLTSSSLYKTLISKTISSSQVFLYKLNHRIYSLVHGQPQQYLTDIKGVIHVGASSGQERELYSSHQLNVLWIEASFDSFQTLLSNIREYPRQKALNYLVDQDNCDSVKFNIANNNAESSSLLELAEHKYMYPDVSTTESVYLQSRTLNWIVNNELLDLSLYDAMVLDVQGAEIRVMKGASSILHRMRYVEVEVADFYSYQSSPLLSDMNLFMKENGFVLDYLQRASFVPRVGTYYNATYRNTTKI